LAIRLNNEGFSSRLFFVLVCSKKNSKDCRDNDASYPRKELYLNLLQPSEETELEYHFEFLTYNPAKVSNDSKLLE
jgi:hypothetical protein